MGLTNTTGYKVPKVTRPPIGGSYTDAVHGNTVTRVTDAVSEGFPAIVPPYSNRPFLQTQKYGELFLLYRKGSGGGHRLYHAEHPYPKFMDIPWGKLIPDEPESIDCFGSVMEWMTFDGSFYRFDFDAGGSAELIFKITSPSNEVFGDTHGLPARHRRGVSWYVSTLEKRLAIVDLQERRIAWEVPYITPQVTGFQKRTGTPMMAVDGEYFVVPFPRQDAFGVWFYVFHFRNGVAQFERLLCADYTYEHSCQAQYPGDPLEDIYISKTNGGSLNNPKNPSQYIPGRMTPPAFCLVASFEQSTPETSSLSEYLTLFSPPTWGSASGTHLTGGAWEKPSRIAFSCFAPSNKSYRYAGPTLAAGWQEIVVVDLDIAVPSNGKTGFNRVCYHNSATQASDTFGNSAYWAEPHPMLSPNGKLVVFGSDFNFCRPESEWTHGIDTYAVEVES